MVFRAVVSDRWLRRLVALPHLCSNALAWDMPAPFGFSAGDMIAVSILIKDVFKSLDNATDSAAEYQELCRELWSLDRALLEVELPSRGCDTSVELNALSHTVCRTAEFPEENKGV